LKLGDDAQPVAIGAGVLVQLVEYRRLGAFEFIACDAAIAHAGRDLAHG
jgi:hypothetical protein